MLEFIFAKEKDLKELNSWCKDAPEFQKQITLYAGREDTAILIIKEELEIIGIALLKVMINEKTGTVWLYLKERGKINQANIMQESLKWLRKKGAKEFRLI
jgi:hypothetical protein